MKKIILYLLTLILVPPAMAFPGRVYDIRSSGPDEKEDAYPEATMFGKLPAHGFYISHATGIRLSGIQLYHRSDEKRPAFFLHDTEDFSLESDDIISRNKHTPLVMVSESREGAVTVRSTKENVLKTDKASQGVTLYK